MSAVCLIISATGKYFFINTSMEIFTCPGVFILLSSLFFFFGYDIATFSFYFIFLIFCVLKVSLFSLNNRIPSIVLVCCYKKSTA